MAEPGTPKPNKGGTPLAIVVGVILVALVAFALLRHGGNGGVATPSGKLSAPTEATPSAPSAPSTVPNAQQPASQENGAVGHQDNSNEKGGPQRLGNTTG